MTDQSSKIITSFQSRLEMETAVRSLGDTSSDWELRQRASELAQRYGDKVLPVLLVMLDTPQAQLRGGLGHLARDLEREPTVAALRAAAHNRALPDQARLTAITILERFLDVAPEDAMYAGMAAPEQLALGSLREVLLDAQTDSLVLAEYFRQLDEEPLDVQLAMVRAARLLDGAEGAELLGMFAQEANKLIAQEALQTLGMIADPGAGATLQGLLPNLPPDLRQQAERSLQKLRLRGVAVPAWQKPPADARCLASPISGEGMQALWFALPQADGAVTVLQVLVNEQQGILAAHGERAEEAAALPPAQPPGTVMQSAADQPLMLEAGLDYGRRCLLAALPAQWGTDRPLPPVYRLLSPLLWRWLPPQPPAAMPDTITATRADTVRLLEQPAMGSWFLQTSRIYERAEAVLTGSEAPTAESFAALVQETVAAELDSGELTTDALQARLRAMAEWFTLAGDARDADLALAAAQTITDDPATHPLLLLMGELGLRLAIINLARGLVP